MKFFPKLISLSGLNIIMPYISLQRTSALPGKGKLHVENSPEAGMLPATSISKSKTLSKI